MYVCIPPTAKPSSRVAVTSSDDVGGGKVQDDRIDDPPPTDPTDDRIEVHARA